MTAEQAQIDGVVTRVTDAPLMLALEKVKVFSTMSPTALRETKRLMTFDNETLCKMLEEKMKVFSTCLESEEAREAFKKFLKK
jgi:enoyl-CoA hydratase/carnithine racemase